MGPGCTYLLMVSTWTTVEYAQADGEEQEEEEQEEEEQYHEEPEDKE